MKTTVEKLMQDDGVSFDEFFRVLLDVELGDWEQVNDRETVEDYICYMVRQGVAVSHMLSVLEEDPFHSIGHYNIYLGDSLGIPEPITDKKELAEALGLNGSEFLEI